MKNEKRIMNNDLSDNLREQVADAFTQKTPLTIVAGSSKAFYGNQVSASSLDISDHRGILEYQPSELVVTVRSGTLLSDLETELKNTVQTLSLLVAELFQELRDITTTGSASAQAVDAATQARLTTLENKYLQLFG